MASIDMGTITLVFDDSLVVAYRIDNQALRQENEELKRKLKLAEEKVELWKYLSHDNIKWVGDEHARADKLLRRAQDSEAKQRDAEGMVERLIEVGGTIVESDSEDWSGLLEDVYKALDDWQVLVAEWQARNE